MGGSNAMPPIWAGGLHETGSSVKAVGVARLRIGAIIALGFLAWSGCGDDVSSTASAQEAFDALGAAVDCTLFEGGAAGCLQSAPGAECIADECGSRIDMASTGFLSEVECGARCDDEPCQSACLDELDAESRTALEALVSCARSAGCIDADLPGL